MKTDHIFYRIFKELPDTFFELWGESPEMANDYRFDAVELKQTAFRIDGVFLPLDAENPIYFGEVQFQKDPSIYIRFFSKIFTYIRENNPSLRWRAMIIFRSRSIEPTVRQRESVQPLLDSPLVKRIYLNELTANENSSLWVQIIRLIVARKRQFLEEITELIDRVKKQFTHEPTRLELLNLLEAIILAKLPKMSRQELEVMFGVEDLRKTRFAQELIAEGEEIGKIKAQLEIIPPLLAKGFSVNEIAEIIDLSVVRVREYIEQNFNC